MKNNQLESEAAHIALFGAGCFWGVEEAFRKVKGVESVESGYAGGKTENPSYQEVCSDKTGHAEVVHITFNPDQVQYEQLVRRFFDLHDPTTLNRQGPDVGTQYRSVIFYMTSEQQKIAEQVKQELDKSGAFSAPIVTTITPFTNYFRAEEYHQRYLEKRGLGSCHI